MVAVGIDLGTTTTCIAVWRQGSVEVIPNDQGDRTVPSYVAFTNSERLIGELARKQAVFNPRNTIFGTKRLIGRRYDDIGFQMDLRRWPFYVNNVKSKPMISVTYKGEMKHFAPEEISSMILFRVKEIAENYLGDKVTKAVLTVPAYFTTAQREATRAAGVIAGLDVIRVTNESTAAAIAYGCNKYLKNSYIVVYDLGGGSFDVSILRVEENSVYELKASVGNTRLCGEDFDNRLVAYFSEDFRKRYNVDITVNAKAQRRLKTAAEKAKKLLTSAAEITVRIDSLYDSIDYTRKISRNLFEDLCSDLFDDTLRSVEQIIGEAKLTKNDIHKVILVGGSTRIPKIQSMLQEYFDGNKVTICLNPDEAVAHGAAIQAAMLSGEHQEEIEDFILVDVVPLSLGVETVRGVMYKVIEKNTVIPCRQTKDLTTLEDYQNSMTIEVFEGERTLTKDNKLLGAFELKGIPPAPRGVAKIDVTFDVDTNGILNVTAQDRGTGFQNGITIKNEHRLTQMDMFKMIADAEQYREEDRENKKRLESRNQLETYVYNVKNTVKDCGEKLTEEEKLIMAKECQKAIEWLDENPDCLREEFERKMTELMMEWSVVMRKLYENPLRYRAKRRRSEIHSEIECNAIEE